MIPPPLYSRAQLDPQHVQLALTVSDAPLDAGLPRCALRGSLDPSTGIFYKAPEHHARIRTLQACDKCRVRKAKCSGDHPTCERCRTRGLTCHYAPERRARRWIKPKADGELDRRDTHPPRSRPSPSRTTDIGHPTTANVRGSGTRETQADVMGSPKMCCRDGLGTLNDPDHALAHSLNMYTNDPQVVLDSVLTSKTFLGMTDAGRVTLADHDLAYTDPALTRAGCPEGVLDGVYHYPVLFHGPLCSHRSGPGPGPPLSVDPAFDGQALSSCASDANSPSRTPSASTSSTASPVLTRASSHGPPTTPSSYPSPPFTLASRSPILGPYTCDLQAYPPFSSKAVPMIDQSGIWSNEPMWHEVKDGAWEGNAFLDMDAAF